MSLLLNFCLQLLGIITNYSIYICNSPNRDIFISVLYGFKAVMQVIALIFAFSIRKVNVKGLDDSRFIIAAIYVSSVALAVIFVSSITLSDFENAFAVVFCTGFFIATTVILLLVFVPKVLLFVTVHPRASDSLGHHAVGEMHLATGACMRVPGIGL